MRKLQRPQSEELVIIILKWVGKFFKQRKNNRLKYITFGRHLF